MPSHAEHSSPTASPTEQPTLDSSMPVWLNGRFVPKGQAHLSVEDRGTLFADDVYEVLQYCAGKPVGLDRHMARLRRSLGGIRMEQPDVMDRLPTISEELLSRSGVTDAYVYWQVTRGSGQRSFVLPASPQPTVLVALLPGPGLTTLRERGPKTASASLVEDQRWSCCWIKTLMLLPNTLALDDARRAGADKPILHRNNRVTEANDANVFVVRDGALWTHPADQWILGGVTRDIILDLARREGIAVHEEAVGTSELFEADELLLTGTTTHVTAVTRLDDRPIADQGPDAPGPMARRLYEALMGFMAEEVG